jgi:hypothetical protein
MKADIECIKEQIKMAEDYDAEENIKRVITPYNYDR